MYTISSDIINFHWSPWLGRFNHDNNLNISLVLSVIIVSFQGVHACVISPGTMHDKFDAVFLLKHFNRWTGLDLNPLEEGKLIK